MLTLSGLNGPGYGPVDASVAAGRCLAVMGASGSGKTRLLRAIADLDPAAGDCTLNDVSRHLIPAMEWRRRVAYVPAEPGWWAATAADHFIDRVSCRDGASRLGVEEITLDRPVEQLSTGERQRFALVRALQFNPEVLLLDEPTGPLDARTTERVEEEILNQMKAGVGVILVTHDRAQADRLGADVCAIVAGRLTLPPSGGGVI